MRIYELFEAEPNRIVWTYGVRAYIFMTRDGRHVVLRPETGEDTGIALRTADLAALDDWQPLRSFTSHVDPVLHASRFKILDIVNTYFAQPPVRTAQWILDLGASRNIGVCPACGQLLSKEALEIIIGEYLKTAGGVAALLKKVDELFNQELVVQVLAAHDGLRPDGLRPDGLRPDGLRPDG